MFHLDEHHGKHIARLRIHPSAIVSSMCGTGFTFSVIQALPEGTKAIGFREGTDGLVHVFLEHESFPKLDSPDHLHEVVAGFQAVSPGEGHWDEFDAEDWDQARKAVSHLNERAKRVLLRSLLDEVLPEDARVSVKSESPEPAAQETPAAEAPEGAQPIEELVTETEAVPEVAPPAPEVAPEPEPVELLLYDTKLGDAPRVAVVKSDCKPEYFTERVTESLRIHVYMANAPDHPVPLLKTGVPFEKLEDARIFLQERMGVSMPMLDFVSPPAVDAVNIVPIPAEPAQAAQAETESGGDQTGERIQMMSNASLYVQKHREAIQEALQANNGAMYPNALTKACQESLKTVFSIEDYSKAIKSLVGAAEVIEEPMNDPKRGDVVGYRLP